MKALIGVDVGGSKTAAAVQTEDGQVHRAAGPGAAVRPGKALASALIIAEVVRQALGQSGRLEADVLVVGAAGAGRAPERNALRDALRSEALADLVHVTTDIEVALAAAFGEEPGIVVSAGTGSIAVARDRNGRLERIGGYGWQMGDEGGGYDIGRAVLRAVGRAADGRGPATTLERAAREVARAEDLTALLRWAASAGVAEVAALGGAAVRAAEEGDAVAKEIVEAAAQQLADLAQALARRTGVTEAAIGGGIAGTGYMRREISSRLAAGNIKVKDGVPDALEGAKRVASRKWEVE